MGNQPVFLLWKCARGSAGDPGPQVGPSLSRGAPWPTLAHTPTLFPLSPVHTHAHAFPPTSGCSLNLCRSRMCPGQAMPGDVTWRGCYVAMAHVACREFTCVGDTGVDEKPRFHHDGAGLGRKYRVRGVYTSRRVREGFQRENGSVCCAEAGREQAGEGRGLAARGGWAP